MQHVILGMFAAGMVTIALQYLALRWLRGRQLEIAAVVGLCMLPVLVILLDRAFRRPAMLPFAATLVVFWAIGCINLMCAPWLATQRWHWLHNWHCRANDESIQEPDRTLRGRRRKHG